MLTAIEFVNAIGTYALTDSEKAYIRKKQDEAIKVPELSFVLELSEFNAKYSIQVIMALQHDGWKTTVVPGRDQTRLRVEVPIGIIRS